MVAESLIRHRFATRKGLIEFVKTENVPYRSKCLDALALVQSGSDSPKETEMRLTLVRYGLPIMQPNCVVPGVNFANGAAVTLDLVDAEHRFGLDYQGDHHRTDRAQYRRDQNKLSRLAAAGWTVFSVTQLDLSDDVYGQINVYGVTTKSERHKRSYWTRTADGNGIGGRKAPVPYGS